MTFEIYELPLRSGIVALSPMPVDVGDVLAWGADVVLSMNEQSEMQFHIVEALQDADFVWLQFPVADFGVPEADAGWDAMQAQLLAWLTAGTRILIHCKGGCGRSGMAVLRLMIAAGEDADAALARLREVRPCAVETEAQLVWANGVSLPQPL